MAAARAEPWTQAGGLRVRSGFRGRKVARTAAAKAEPWTQAGVRGQQLIKISNIKTGFFKEP